MWFVLRYLFNKNLDKLDDNLKKGQYPFNDNELDKLESIKLIKGRKKYLRKLKDKYKGHGKI